MTLDAKMWYLSIDIFKLQIGSMSFVLYNNVFWWPLTQKLETWLEVWQMGRFNMSLDAKHDMWTYLVSYSVKWKYWNVPCRENEILAYMATILINMKVEFVPWFKTWYFNLFGFKCGKMKVLKWPLSRSLINGKSELVPWRHLLQTWYVNLFGFVFCKMKVLDWPLSRKWDFALYANKFDKWDVWTCPLMRNMIYEPIWFCIL